MKALVYEGAWQMPLREVPTPAPAPGELLVQVRAVGICGSDVHGYMGTTGRRTPPIIMGHEVSGVVVENGGETTRFRPGDRVVIQPLLTCGVCPNCRSNHSNICLNRGGLGMTRHGAYAEWVSVPESMLHALPDELDWEQGAMVEPLAVALRAVNLTPLSLMDSVIIIGAGPIGLLTLVAARLKGAGVVIMTDLSPHRLELARSLGADVTINVGDSDPLAIVQDHTGGLGASAVIEAVGINATVQQSLALARSGGHITWIGNSQPEVTVNMQSIVTRELTIRGAYGFNDEFTAAIEALRCGRVDIRPLIEKRAPLEAGVELVHSLATGTLDAAKVILNPGS